MREVFKLIFLLRYRKPEKLKVTLRDYFFITNYYFKNNLRKYTNIRSFYYMVLMDSIDNFHTFDKAVDFVHLDIINKLIIEYGG